MAIESYEIPVSPEYGDFEQAVSMGGIEYLMRFTYIARGRYWTLSLYDADGTARVEGRRIVKGLPLFQHLPQARPRYGMLIAYGDVDVPYDRDVLGDTLKLFYVTDEVG